MIYISVYFKVNSNVSQPIDAVKFIWVWEKWHIPTQTQLSGKALGGIFLHFEGLFPPKGFLMVVIGWEKTKNSPPQDSFPVDFGWEL